ncbi:uncharacterized protein LOC126676632 [Mercurialis annua]|uniref:uncharacterized protein LOC126676632 n=1 Tax=Mercurialis annua TaxID=3986 RepID=UPI00215F88C5|nr:uncharacterized protein LOC126676632 [Mercurialis annua]
MMNILKQHQGPTIAELRIRLPDHWVHRFFERQLHSLITMGMQKRVKSLLIDFRKFFILQEPMQRLGSVCSFTLLVSLHLINAKISTEFIHHLLSNSPALELLSIVDSSGDLGHLKFCGPCLKLKHLELRRNEIRILEISAAPHIESLELFPINKDIKIIFKDIPSLTRLSCSFIVIKELLMLRTLKEINLSLDGDCLEELHSCFNLIDAFPVLTKASFNMDDYFAYWDYDYEFSNLSYYTGRPKHQCLKVVEIFGFRGHEYEQELGTYLAHYASNLRKIRVRPCAYNDDEFMTCRLQKLKSMLPPSVELEILSVNSLLF